MKIKIKVEPLTFVLSVHVNLARSKKFTPFERIIVATMYCVVKTISASVQWTIEHVKKYADSDI